ncbi:hypothetical protein ACWGH5_39740 [Streptomyces sp. NPDC054864]
MRQDARRAAESEQLRSEGLPVESSAGALLDERREQLEDIGPSWSPTWPAEWQRAFHLVRLPLEAGPSLPTKPYDVVHQGENLGRWMCSIRLGRDRLHHGAAMMCEQVLEVPARVKPHPRALASAPFLPVVVTVN